MWPRFGIKVGNSTLCIAYSKEDGKVEVIANKQGDRVSQACVLFDGVNEIECGLTAKQKMATRPKQGVGNSFQLLLPDDDLTDEKIEAAIGQITCEYDSTENVFELRHVAQGDDDKDTTRLLSPYEVQVQLFRAELELARQYHNDAEQKPIVVLSIPSYYPKDAWPMLTEAAEEAGFHVAQVICEPTAAVLAHAIGEETSLDTKYVLAIKSGGLFSHFALYAVRNGMYSQLDAFGPFPIGGRHYTEALVQFICDEFRRKYKLDPHESRRSLAKIRTAAANCKHILTTLPSTQLYIDSLMDGVDFNAQMSRARFESLIQPVISEFMQTLGECVERAMQTHSNVKNIDHIVLLGATMAIPKLQSVIAARFPDAQLHTSTPTDEVVAVGCARQAIFLVEPTGQELELADECTCTHEQLFIWHGGEDEENAQVLLEKGTVLPTTVRLDVKQNKETEHKESFWLRVGDAVNEICLQGAVPAEDGVFQIEANVDLTEQDNDVVPTVRLRSL